MHLPDAGDDFLAILCAVQQPRPGLQDAAIDSQEVQIAVLIGGNLEKQGRHRVVGVGTSLDLLVAFGVRVSDDGGDLGRGRQVGYDRIQESADAYVLQRRSAQHRMHPPGDRGPADRRDDVVRGYLLFV